MINWRPTCLCHKRRCFSFYYSRHHQYSATLRVPEHDVLRTNCPHSLNVFSGRPDMFYHLYKPFFVLLCCEAFIVSVGDEGRASSVLYSLSLGLGLRGKQLPCPRGNVAFFPIRLFACDGQRSGFGSGCDVGCSLWARTQRGVEARGCFWQSHPHPCEWWGHTWRWPSWTRRESIRGEDLLLNLRAGVLHHPRVFFQLGVRSQR